MAFASSDYPIGARVRVTQQVPRLTGVMTTSVEGTVLRFGQQKTGSWFAHAKDDKLWLDRLVIRKDDGEISTLNLDDYSNVQVETPAGDGEGGGSEKKNESDLPV